MSGFLLSFKAAAFLLTEAEPESRAPRSAEFNRIPSFPFDGHIAKILFPRAINPLARHTTSTRLRMPMMIGGPDDVRSLSLDDSFGWWMVVQRESLPSSRASESFDNSIGGSTNRLFRI